MGYCILALLFAVWFFSLWLEQYLLKKYKDGIYLIFLFDIRDFFVIAAAFVIVDNFWLKQIFHWQYYATIALLSSFVTAAIRRVFLK